MLHWIITIFYSKTNSPLIGLSNQGLNNHDKCQMMMKNCDKSVEIKYNVNWLCILDHSDRILIIVGLTSDKINALLTFNDQILTKLVYMSKIHSNHSINYSSRQQKKYGLNKRKIQKGIYWLFRNNWWRLWKFRRLWYNKEKKTVNSVWWYDSRNGN